MLTNRRPDILLGVQADARSRPDSTLAGDGGTEKCRQDRPARPSGIGDGERPVLRVDGCERAWEFGVSPGEGEAGVAGRDERAEVGTAPRCQCVPASRFQGASPIVAEREGVGAGKAGAEAPEGDLMRIHVKVHKPRGLVVARLPGVCLDHGTGGPMAA